jgi:hypothetical protein
MNYLLPTVPPSTQGRRPMEIARDPAAGPVAHPVASVAHGKTPCNNPVMGRLQGVFSDLRADRC